MGQHCFSTFVKTNVLGWSVSYVKRGLNPNLKALLYGNPAELPE